jgi:hypothetical protein
MKLKITFIFTCTTFAAFAATMTLAARPAFAQPTITLPPEEPKTPPRQPPAPTPAPAPDQPQAGIPRPPLLQLQRESQIEVPLEQTGIGGATALGGYGELTFNAPSNGPNVVDMRRLVLYVGHNFTERLRLYAELEVEHAVTSADDQGEFEVEQAFLDYLAWKPLNFRAGVIIMPMGIINQYHEPPTFNGVDRPETDTLIIPSTWREPGAGIFGEYASIRYQAYVVNGFNATGFTAAAGLREGHQEAQLALGVNWGIVARVSHAFPYLYKYGVSAELGIGYYFSRADQGKDVFKGSEGNEVPVTMLEADLRARTRGLELRAEIASVWIGGIHRLNRGLETLAAEEMKDFEGPVANQLIGGYVELGYNVLHPLKLRRGMALVPFMRYEHVDTQFQLPSDLARVPGNRHDIITAGVVFRPIAEVAVKLDYQHFWTDAVEPENASFDSYNAGLAFMF